MKKILSFTLALLATCTMAFAAKTQTDPSSYDCGDSVRISATANTGWHFLKWSDNNTENPRKIEVAEDVKLTAIFEIDSFLIVFVNYDNTELQRSYVDYGFTPTYDMTTHGIPTKPATPEWSYTFTGWNPTIEAATHDTVYVAVFDSTKVKYAIIFQNEDSTQLQKDSVAYGETPTYKGESPTKPSPEPGKSYTWEGWTEEIVPVTGEKTYTAKFKETLNQYNVVVSADPTKVADVLGNGEYTYNASVTVSYTITNNCYKFVGWYENDVLVSSDSNYTFKMPLKDRNLVAKFEKIKYKVSVDPDDPKHGSTMVEKL